jgi:hypothetical protein
MMKKISRLSYPPILIFIPIPFFVFEDPTSELSDENQSECHEIEPNPSKDRAMPEGDNPLFGDEFPKFTFFLTVQFIFVRACMR